jgi:hypothetical protein
MTRPAAPRKTAVVPASRPVGSAATSRRVTAALTLVRCPPADDLWPYLAGELPAARARAVARHVRTCAACAGRARRLRAMLEECRAAGCQQLPRDVRARARARARALVRARRV